MSVVNQEPDDRRLQPPERLAAERAEENERGRTERSVRVRSAAFGFFIGGLLGLFIGHMGLLILEAHEAYLLANYWNRELITFDDQRPLIPAYFIGGGLAGALVSYYFLVLRSSITGIRGWVLGTLGFAFGAVFLIGYFASLMIMNFLDPVIGPLTGGREAWGGFRFAFSLFGAVPSSFSIMGGAFYVGYLSTGIFLLLWAGAKVALERTANLALLGGRMPFAAVIYFSAASLAAIPYLVSILGPESMIRTLVSLLASLET